MPETSDTEVTRQGRPSAGLMAGSEDQPAAAASSAADRVALGAMQTALALARESGEDRPALEMLAGSLAEMGVRAASTSRSRRLLARDRDAWLRRLQSAERSASSLSAYRHAIDDLLAWAERAQRAGELFEEQAIVDYLDDYRKRCEPAPATYHRRFLLLRRFMAWVSQRDGLPDPFAELQAPPKPRQEAEWLTREEFARLLDGAEHPARARPGPRRARPARAAHVGVDRPAALGADRARLGRRDIRRSAPVAAGAPRQGRQRLVASRYPPSSRRRSSAGAQSGAVPPRRTRCSAVWLVGGFSRRSSLASSVAPRSAQVSPST